MIKKLKLKLLILGVNLSINKFDFEVGRIGKPFVWKECESEDVKQANIIYILFKSFLFASKKFIYSKHIRYNMEGITNL